MIVRFASRRRASARDDGTMRHATGATLRLPRASGIATAVAMGVLTQVWALVSVALTVVTAVGRLAMSTGIFNLL